MGATNSGVEMSPLPEAECQAALDLLGQTGLSVLVEVSPSSLRRYAAGTRTAPQAVDARVQVLMLIITDLAGSYSGFGTRRWFGRSHPQLDGQAPRDLLAGGFDPDGPAAAQVRAESRALVGAGTRAHPPTP